MSILPNSQLVSHSPFPAQRATHESPLLLPAPKIAGLLGTGETERASHDGRASHDHYMGGAEKDADQARFTFVDWRLATLDAEQRRRFSDAAQTLLGVALRFAIDEMNEDALRAAQVLFHRKLTGHSPRRPMTPVAFRAEGDADLLDVLLSHEKRRTEQDDSFERRWAERIAARRNGKTVGHD